MQLFIGSLISETEAQLSEEESWHCVKVLRHKEGDDIHVMDGKGNFYRGRIISANPKNCLVKIEERTHKEFRLPYQLHIAIAPTKNIDRIEWFAEKAVEIGISKISFIQTKNSERKVIKTDRIHKIVESAAKQSMQAWIPEVSEMLPLKEFIKDAGAAQKLIAHCQSSDLPYFARQIEHKGEILFLIGPEGDFTIEEIKLATESGFAEVNLGSSRLRTETAALYVCNALAVMASL